jgi:hypothetical protein
VRAKSASAVVGKSAIPTQPRYVLSPRGSFDRGLIVSRGGRQLATRCRPVWGLNRSWAKRFQGLTPPSYALVPFRGLDRWPPHWFQGLTPPGYVLSPRLGAHSMAASLCPGADAISLRLAAPFAARSIIDSRKANTRCSSPARQWSRRRFVAKGAAQASFVSMTGSVLSCRAGRHGPRSD